MFWHNDALQFLISVVGRHRLHRPHRVGRAAASSRWRWRLPQGQAGGYAIVGALSLYLDFINLFLMLLRFTGSRRE